MPGRWRPSGSGRLPALFCLFLAGRVLAFPASDSDWLDGNRGFPDIEERLWAGVEHGLRFADIRVESVGRDPTRLRVQIDGESRSPLDPPDRDGLEDELREIAAEVLASPPWGFLLDEGSWIHVWSPEPVPGPPPPPRPRRRRTPLFSGRGRVVLHQVVDMPNADALPPGGLQVDARLFQRRTGTGVFTELVDSTATGLDLAVRYGWFHGVEISLGGGAHELTATGTVPGALPDEGRTLTAPVIGLKIQLRGQLLGGRVALGTQQGLVTGDDRSFLQPDDHERWTPFYVAWSRHLGAWGIGHLVFRRSRVTATDSSRGTNHTSFGMGYELEITPWTRLQLEGVKQTLGTRRIGAYGDSVGYSGTVVNLGLTRSFGSRFWVTAFGRRVDRAEHREAGLRVSWRFR